MKPFLFLFLTTVGLAIADSSIDPTKNHAYSANAGWVNLRPSASDGVVFGEAFLSGYAYAANFGWINLGDGSPADLQAYQNDTATDYGVNHDGLGNLTGYAYGANIGWIDFGWAATSDSNRAQVDLSTGAFSGYAYAANVGWINLSTDLTTESMTSVDSDSDGIGDAWEIKHFGTLATADATTNNDDDEQSDLAEYLANTDPQDENVYLDVSFTSIQADFGLTGFQIEAGAGRAITLEHDTVPDFSNLSALTYTPLAEAGIIEDLQTFSVSDRRFFRVRVALPLQ